MSAGTDIEWSDDTWNFLAGCTKVSRGCKNCYAARLAATRLAHTAKYKGLAMVSGPGTFVWSNEVAIDSSLLPLPLGWAPGKDRPRRIFVNSMSDLFHDDVDDLTILKAFTVMANTPWHQYIILTKRPRRMRQFCSTLAVDDVGWDSSELAQYGGKGYGFQPYRKFVASLNNAKRKVGPKLLDKIAVLGRSPAPLPNVTLGVSVEDRATFEERIWDLRGTPAAVRLISAEPLVESLGDISIATGGLNPIHWLIVGGESGPLKKVGEFDIQWALDLREQCKGTDVAFFFKQPGAKPVYGGTRELKANWTRLAIDSGKCLADLPAEYPLTFRYR